MTRITDIGQKFEKLPAVIAEYENVLKDAEDLIRLKGKMLVEANKENPAWQLFYDQKRIELATLSKFLESQVLKIRGKLFRSLCENHQLDLSDRAKDKYIDNEKEYLDIYELFLEVDEIYKKYQAVVDAFQARSYSLNNLTKIHVAQLENIII